MKDTNPDNQQLCNRRYGNYPSTIQIIDGVWCCPSCKKPVKEHKS